MTGKLKPLILPQLLEERRRLDDSQAAQDMIEVSPLFLTDNTSSSDITSPATPTFSHRSGLGHLRCSSSTSSLDLALPSPPFSECPASPTSAVAGPPGPSTAAQSKHVVSSSSKRPLPDVQEEDASERGDEEEGDDTLLVQPGLYDCLCDEPCSHRGAEPDSRRRLSNPQSNDYYDLGFVSDSDPNTFGPLSLRKVRRGGSVSAAVGAFDDSSFASLTTRLGTRFQALSRWRSGAVSERSYGGLSGAPASEPALSRAPSSRSSSLSSPGRALVEPPLPMTPSISFYDSTDSIAPVTSTASAVIDIDQEDVRRSLERDRAMSTTPLLPPLFTDIQPPSSPLPLSLHPSPLQSPTVASPSIASPSIGTISDGTTFSTAKSTPTSFDTSSFTPVVPPALSVLGTPFTDVLPSPPLSTKISVSSFHPPATTQNLSAPPALELQDEWSDRLGHANYTIIPKPYLPQLPNLDRLHLLRADWNQARVNYTKHLVRVGEHYGTTSNTYVLTEAKWAETEREWKTAHDSAIAQVLARGDIKECATVSALRLHDDVSSSMVPRIRDAEGKFPDLGDEDIVGPMVRETSMARRDSWLPTEKRAGARFWRSLAGKVGIRKQTL